MGEKVTLTFERNFTPDGKPMCNGCKMVKDVTLTGMGPHDTFEEKECQLTGKILFPYEADVRKKSKWIYKPVKGCPMFSS